MKNEMTPLEALENLWYGQKTTENYKIVENALKKLRFLDKYVKKIRQENYELNKKAEALEIIKTFNFALQIDDVLKLFISQEKYDLLKEVLNNER